MNDRSKAQLLWRISAGYRVLFSGAIIAMAIGYVFMFGVPLIAKFSLDAIMFREDLTVPEWLLIPGSMIAFGSDPGLVHYLVLAAIATLLLTISSGVFLYLRGRLVAIASEGIIQHLRDIIFSHLEHLPSSYHDKADTGDLVQRCTSDMETVRVFLAGQVIEISRALLMLLIVLPILFTLDASMAWLSLVSMPFLFLSAIIFFQIVKSLFLEVDESEARMTTVLQENLTGIRVVRAFARQAFEIEKFADKNAEFRDQNTRLVRLLALYYGLSDFICLGQIGVLLIVGALWVVDGALTVGTLFAFLTYEGMIIWPIRHIGRVLTDSGKAIVSIGRLAEALNHPIESQDEEYPGTHLQGKIEFRHVNFAYDEEKPVIRDLSFEIETGQTLALLGPPGSGKSTITQILMRLYDYDSQAEGSLEEAAEGSLEEAAEGSSPPPSILLDGVEISTLARKYVRSQISIVLQEPFLYSMSILDNLRVGKMSASFEEVEQATQSAAIHDSITRFPNGYDSMVGERGVTLSGGQRQRLALARALLKQPPILILDDALSAVDTDTEAQILAALKKTRADKTTIIVAHRLSTVMHADKIIVLNHGRVEQEGNHEQLSGQEGTYRRLCEIQGAIQQQIDSDVGKPQLTGSTYSV